MTERAVGRAPVDVDYSWKVGDLVTQGGETYRMATVAATVRSVQESETETEEESEMATVQGWLDAAGFDWESGRVVVHEVEPVDANYVSSPGDGTGINPREVQRDDPMLTTGFNDDFGAPECPRFVAFDNTRIYFPGSTTARRG